MVGLTDDGLYRGPDGRPIDGDRERELVRLALNDAWGFEYHAPHERRDWWGVFWESIERAEPRRRVTGQAPLSGWSA